MRVAKTSVILTIIILIIGLAFACRSSYADNPNMDSNETVEKSWVGYKYYFIKQDGRVIRPKDNDTVSEAQAYAMLRAIWMDDKETFDRCYRWTESNLSRLKDKDDNLLAWGWKDGSIIKWMPSSDADVNYALSLVFADSRWKGEAPKGLEDYGKKAYKVINDIMKFETYSTPGGRLYLAPWILNNTERQLRFPVNPSYYSPAYFRIFYEYTKDTRWQKLADTTYYIFDALSKNFNDTPGVGLIPDWCCVDRDDKFHPLTGRSADFGWDAARIPFSIGLDFFFFGSKEARQFFDSGLSKFIEKEWLKNGAVYSEYNYNGTSNNKYENALFYAAYYFSLKISQSPYASEMLKKTRSYILRNKDKWVYEDDKEYYVNSWAWFTEGLNSGKIKNLVKE